MQSLNDVALILLRVTDYTFFFCDGQRDERSGAAPRPAFTVGQMVIQVKKLTLTLAM